MGKNATLVLQLAQLFNEVCKLHNQKDYTFDTKATLDLVSAALVIALNAYVQNPDK